MKNLKSLLSLFFFCLFLSSNTFANGIETEPVSSWQDQFITYLSDLDFDESHEVSKTIYVDFMLNDMAEIIVFSTSEKELDRTIKAKLNYKKIASHDLNYNQRYTLPVVFRK